MLTVILCGLIAGASASFKPEMLVSSFRVLSGADFLSAVHDHCEQPIKDFGYCFVGKDKDGKTKKPTDKLGGRLWASTEKQLSKFREAKEVRILKSMFEDVATCMSDTGKCPLKPLDAARCFLDFVLHGGPHDRFDKCVKDSWGTPLVDVSIPEFADLSQLEEDLGLFAAVGLYKRYKKGKRLFWRQFGNQLRVLCKPGGTPKAVPKCIEAAVSKGERANGGPLKLKLKKYFGGRGVVDMAAGGLAAESVAAFGDKDDVQALLRLLLNRLVSCSFDLFGGADQAMRAVFNQDPCLTSVCVHHMWTIKEAVCVECRSSLSSRGVDPFKKVVPFLRSVAAEYKSVAAKGYECQLKEEGVCEQCQASARHWKKTRTPLLKGIRKEAAAAVGILKTFCSVGGDSGTRIEQDACPAWSRGDFALQ